MAIALVSTIAQAQGSDSVTTPSRDTTGANLIIIAKTENGSGNASTISDSKGNSYTPLTEYSSGAGGDRVRLYYAVNPTVGSGHTATMQGTSPSALGTITLAAFSGLRTTSTFCSENGATFGSGVTFNGGTVSDSSGAPSYLLISALSFGLSATITIEGSVFQTPTITQPPSGSVRGGGFAYGITPSNSVTGIWDSDVNNDAAVTIAMFAGAVTVWPVELKLAEKQA